MKQNGYNITSNVLEGRVGSAIKKVLGGGAGVAKRHADKVRKLARARKGLGTDRMARTFGG